MTKTVNLDVTNGVPFSRVIGIALPHDRDWWTAVSDFEFLMQVREKPSTNACLIIDLAPYLSWSMTDADNVLLNFVMTGNDTRKICANGYYDLIMSDVGTIDVRAKILIAGQVRVKNTVTAGKKADR